MYFPRTFENWFTDAIYALENVTCDRHRRMATQEWAVGILAIVAERMHATLDLRDEIDCFTAFARSLAIDRQTDRAEAQGQEQAR